jgi:hypothetical protein
VGSAEEPLLRVVRGRPADDELAALVAVVSAFAAAAGAAAEEAARAPWANPRALVRPPLAHGRGAWRASGLPG